MPEKSVPIKWRKQKQRYALSGTKCSCGNIYYPPRRLCKCGEKTTEASMSGEGEIISFTEIHAAPSGFEAQTPYMIGLIKLKEGPVITAHIIGSSADIGKKVRPVFRRTTEDGATGVISYGIKFEVVQV